MKIEDIKELVTLSKQKHIDKLYVNFDKKICKIITTRKEKMDLGVEVERPPVPNDFGEFEEMEKTKLLGRDPHLVTMNG